MFYLARRNYLDPKDDRGRELLCLRLVSGTDQVQRGRVQCIGYIDDDVAKERLLAVIVLFQHRLLKGWQIGEQKASLVSRLIPTYRIVAMQT